MTIPTETSSSISAAERPFGRATGRLATLGAVTIGLALLSGLFTFLVLTGLTPIVPTHNAVVSTLFVNSVLVIGLFGLIGYEITRLVIARRRGIAGARLHGRIVGLFALVAALPAVIVAVVASVTLDRGLDRWFSTRTRSIVESSASVAQAYLDEHSRVIRADLLAMASDLEGAKELYDKDKTRFDEYVRAQTVLRSLPGAYVLRKDYSIITKIVQREGDQFLVPPQFALDKADEGEVIVLTPGMSDQSEQVGALVKLQNYDAAYLYVVRRLDATVVKSLRETAEAAAEYRTLEERRFGVQLAFGLMYLGVSLILLLSSVWIGFWFANRLVAPIRRLIGAAELVSSGNLDVQVPVKPSEGDLASLGATFNGMTNQLRSQRDELLKANEMLDTRRRFTEAVLAGVTAGVIGLDPHGTVNLVNRSAETILNLSAKSLTGRPLQDAVPELSDVVNAVIKRKQRLAQGQIKLVRAEQERNITVRVTTEGAGPSEHGYVVTLDDITELVSAQRTSAWADIARRIAHEIKNPLTPIQLSAERLKRKYGRVIEQDREVFEQCTDTIIRQVGDIGRMVDEFSSFARMPRAVLAEHDIAEAVRQAVFLISVTRPDIEMRLNIPGEPVICVCDQRLIAQAVTNIVKNASEALVASCMEAGETPWIAVDLMVDDATVRIGVTDNGCGLPQQNRHRLLEPYMTTRDKGTGLGLAIVRKIIEDHGGTVTLEDAPQVREGGHGARVCIEFPRSLETEQPATASSRTGVSISAGQA